MEKPLYPSPYMRITQGYMQGTHANSYAIDEAGSDSGIDYLVAPFTGVIKKIYTLDANEVWLESVEPVIYPDGTVDYMTIMFAHDNDVSNLFVGKVINRGERFYEEGTKGNATGNHVHIECGKGKFTGTGWHRNASGYYSINNGKNPTECLWIDDSITILNSYGYEFRKIEVDQSNSNDEVVLDPPSEDLDGANDNEVVNQNDSDNTSDDSNNIKLIFTCKKTDLYAINLQEGQKLYLE